MAIARADQAYRPLGWLEPEEFSPSLGVEGSLDYADVKGGVFEDGCPFPLAAEPLHGSALVSAQGSVFGNVTRKDDLGVSRPGFLPWVGNSPSLMTPPEGLWNSAFTRAYVLWDRNLSLRLT